MIYLSEGINKDSTNVLIIGKSGVGKSSLLNYIFGRELQKVGVGAPVTKMEIKKFTYKYDDHFEMHIYDTWGLEPSVQKAEDWKNTIFKEIGRHDEKKISEWFNTIIFCLNAKSARVEDFEIDIMEELLREKHHVTIAMAHCNSCKKIILSYNSFSTVRTAVWQRRATRALLWQRARNCYCLTTTPRQAMRLSMP